MFNKTANNNYLFNFQLFVKGHSKSTFVEGSGRGSLKSERKRIGEGVGFLAFVYVRFLKKIHEIFKMKFYSYSPVFPVDYNGSRMKD